MPFLHGRILHIFIQGYDIHLNVPAGIECERCVLQWFYQTGNSQDTYPEGFWNCADVKVSNRIQQSTLRMLPFSVLDSVNATTLQMPLFSVLDSVNATKLD